MTQKTLGDSLLELNETPPQQQYQAQIESLYAKEDQKLQKQQKRTRWLWIYLVLLSTVFLVIGGFNYQSNKGLWFGILACFWMGFGAIYLNQMWHDRNRLELRKEIARLDLTVQRLAEQIESQRDPS